RFDCLSSALSFSHRLFSFLSTVRPFPRPLPPRYPLFPYTTLFRSEMNLKMGRLNNPVMDIIVPVSFFMPVIYLSTVLARCRAREDRKSTRLNSSHVSNSYADFCV